MVICFLVFVFESNARSNMIEAMHKKKKDLFGIDLGFYFKIHLA